MAKIIAEQTLKLCSYGDSNGDCCLNGVVSFEVAYDAETAKLTRKCGKKIYSCNTHTQAVKEKVVLLQDNLNKRNELTTA